MAWICVSLLIFWQFFKWAFILLILSSIRRTTVSAVHCMRLILRCSCIKWLTFIFVSQTPSGLV
jgi:hypothetical protein